MKAASINHRIMFAFRSVPGPGKTEKDAYAYSKRLKMYYLSQAKNPPEQPIYDRATFAFIYTESNRTTLDSYGLDKMKKNADGSGTLYVGPTAPDGLESNWIPTGGKRPMPTFRFYGPDEPFYDKTFKMPDFERVD